MNYVTRGYDFCSHLKNEKYRNFRNCIPIFLLKNICSTSLHPPLKANPSSPLFVWRRSALDRAYQRPSHSIAPFFSISVCQEIFIEKHLFKTEVWYFSINISWQTEIEKNGALLCDGLWYALSNALLHHTNRGELGFASSGGWRDET